VARGSRRHAGFLPRQRAFDLTQEAELMGLHVEARRQGAFERGLQRTIEWCLGHVVAQGAPA
jgi:hypothetical protein